MRTTKKYQSVKQKTVTLSLVLMLTLSAMVVALPLIHAQDADTWDTYAYIVVSPNPTGVNQAVFVVFWIDKIPVSAAGVGGDRWTDYRIKVTKPNGDIDNLGPYISDPTSSAYDIYTPDQIGTYSFEFTFPGQVASLYHPETGIAGSNSPYIGDTFLGSSATTTLTVTEDVVEKIPEYPLPTEYWTRPIEGQNTAWASISSNWLNGDPVSTYNYQPDGLAPNTAHVMWTKYLQDGGVVGGNTAIEGQTYYMGDSYEMRFNNPMIIQGRLYYDLPLSSDKSGGGYMCVDLLTGETIWYSEDLAVADNAAPSFGQIFDYESFNQHGATNGYLWQTAGNTWNAYDAVTGKWLFTQTEVPSGTQKYGDYGEILRYVYDSENKWLALWNNTQHNVGLERATTADGTTANDYQWRPVGKEVNMSTAYTWNVTLPSSIPDDSSVVHVIPDDLMLCSTPTNPSGFANYGTLAHTMFAISLNPATRGDLLWTKTFPTVDGDISQFTGPIDEVNRVFTKLNKETMQWSGYSLDDGSYLWGPVGNPRDFQVYSSRSGGAGSQGTSAYGILYDAGYGGLVIAYDTANGDVLWTYGNGGEGNSTNSGLETAWGNYPTFIGCIADGKIYTFTAEHSVNMPIYKDARIRCIDAFTGEELWTLMGFATSTSFYSRIGAIADGYLAYLNAYDGQVYCIGKGPSETTVTASPEIIACGTSVMIKGSVIDTASGTTQNEQAARFPHGVPAVADSCMSEWMEYVYMQKPFPDNVEGVRVTLTAVDANGNTQNIGTVTTDASGMFKKMWTPEIEGEYTVIATFAGTESYWGSYAQTAFGVDPAVSTAVPITPEEPETPDTETPDTETPDTETPDTEQPTAETALISTEVAIIAVVAVAVVVGAAAFWTLRKRK
ncbi:MAG: PQQ-binding-like beta-propeller repeat protein [Candidatus Bathyarchaeota archaeon]|nr:PQQ-binding-like beta-propeller repeat protein [Candidatus Bathyarchaeum sp.]